MQPVAVAVLVLRFCQRLPFQALIQAGNFLNQLRGSRTFKRFGSTLIQITAQV